MSHLVAVDPGIRGCGVSYWWPDGTLRLATYVTGQKKGDGPAVWAAMAVALANSCSECWTEKPTFIVELPKIYRLIRAPDVDPEDILQLTAVVGTLVGTFRPNASEVIAVRPSEWKGQLPKDVHHRRIKKKLKPEELHNILLPAKSLQHNVLDAIGIGLYHLKKIGARR